MKRRATLTAIALLAGLSAAIAAEQPKPIAASVASIPAKILFGKMQEPSEQRAQSIGGYADGCLAGAKPLPLTGPVWQVMRPSRNRNWGNPAIIAFLERFGQAAHDAGDWPGLLVGDIAQPRGGPMLSGHASHQIGLDADIWLTPMPSRVLTTAERETMVPRKVVKDHYTIDKSVWTDAHAKLIARAASDPEVARIFVHPPIKKAMCDFAAKQGTTGPWLAKIRPYYGHDFHFHVRLRCPAGSPACAPQKEPEPVDGTGCGPELQVWLSKSFWARRQPPNPEKPVKPGPSATLAALPPACKAVLAAP